MKKLILALLVLSTGCGADSLADVASGNNDLRVSLIGHIPDHDCDIYRIEDAYTVYAVVCPDVKAVETSVAGTESAGGKNSRRAVRRQVVVTPSER